MPSLGTLTEADLRQWLAGSVHQGAKYVKRVQNPTRIGETLSAQVIGGRVYEVEVTVKASGLSSRCQCSWGGNCKHVAAVLLKWIQSPSSFAATEAIALRDQALEVIPVEPPKTHRPKDLPWWLRSSFEGRRQAERQQFHQWLYQISLQDLRALAKERGWPVKGNNKQAVTEQIAEQMVMPENIFATLHTLDAEHQRVLYAMVLMGYSLGVKPEDVERVARAWGNLPGRKQIAAYIADLRQMGLAVQAQNVAYRTVDLAPNVIVRQLVPALDALVRPPGSGSAALPRLADPYPFVRALHQVAVLLEQSSVPLRPPMPRPQIERFIPGLQQWDYEASEVAAIKHTRPAQSAGYLDVNFTVPPPRAWLPDEAIERLAPIAGDAARLEFMLALLVTAGVFQPGSPVTVWQEVKERFLRLDEMAQRAVLSHTYMTMPAWSEVWEAARAGNLRLARVGGYGNFKPANLSSDLTNFRLAVLRVLACLPDDEWIAFADLFHLMRTVLPRFDGAVWSPYYGPPNMTWYLTQVGHDTPLEVNAESNWNLAQGNFIRQIITGPLHWLGWVDLGVADQDQVVAFRLHGLGDLYWDRVEAPPAPQHAALQAVAARDASQALATEGLTITVNPTTIKAQAHGLLEHVARLESAKTDHFVYRLDAQAVYRTFEAGAALADILHDWERLLPSAMPEAIHAQLTQWWEAYGRVRIYENLAVIEFSDDYALAEIRAVTALEQHLVAEISPRLAIINKEAIPALTAELEKAGYTPKQTSDV